MKLLRIFLTAFACLSSTFAHAEMIDSHVHIIKNPELYPWIKPRMLPLQKKVTLKEVKEMLDTKEVDRCILVHANNKQWETYYLLHIANKNDFVAGVIGWVDMTDPWITAELDRMHTMSSKLCGVRAMLTNQKDPNFIHHPDFLHGLKAVGKEGLTFDLLVEPHHLRHVVKVVKLNSKRLNWNFGQQKFVLDHLGKPPIGPEGLMHLNKWKKHMTELSKCPNVWVKVSGLVNEVKQDTWELEWFYEVLDFVYEQFGAEKMIYGSNYPVCRLKGAEYEDVFSIMTSWMDERGLSTKERQMIFGGSAKVAYNLQ